MRAPILDRGDAVHEIGRILARLGHGVFVSRVGQVRPTIDTHMHTTHDQKHISFKNHGPLSALLCSVYNTKKFSTEKDFHFFDYIMRTRR